MYRESELPLFRRNDPATSVEAALRAEPDSSVALIVYRILSSASGPMTDAEIEGAYSGRLTPDRLRHGRLSLQRRGIVRFAGKKPGPRARTMRAWELV